MLVAEENSEIIATGFLDGPEMGGIYVHPERQKQGIGTALVEKLLEMAHAKRLKRIWLDSTPIARPLYSKMGFKIVCPATQIVNGVPLNYYKMEFQL